MESFSSLFFLNFLLIVIMLNSSNFFSLAFDYDSLNMELLILGDAHYDEHGDISLTRKRIGGSAPSSSFIGAGRALYSHPIRFRDSKTNSTASFMAGFTFCIASSTFPKSFGDGFTFLITTDATTVGNSIGYMGLPRKTSHESFFAVEFDTSFDPSLEDISDNHIGIDINSVVSFASVDATSMIFDLKSGKRMTTWLEYLDSEKMIKVWVGCSNYSRSTSEPILATHIDLSMYLQEFMYVGFSASNNGKGSALHLVEKWGFKTTFLMPNSSSASTDTRAKNGSENFNSSDTRAKNGSENFNSSSSSTGQIEGRGWVEALLFLVGVMIVGGTIWLVLKKFIFDDDDHGPPTLQLSCFNTISIRMDEPQTQIPLPLNHQSPKTLSLAEIRNLQYPKTLSLAEIKSATRGFHQSRIISEEGRWGSTAYEGYLASGRGEVLPIRHRFIRFNHIINSGYDPFSSNEWAPMCMGCLKHKNLLQLQGWCSEENEVILVYQYLPHGRTLNRLLHHYNTNSAAEDNSPTMLNWEHRFKIVLGVASALAFLHEECDATRPIIHGDIRSSNILIDADFTAKLGEFGIRDLYTTREVAVATIPTETRGYLPPEYLLHTSGVPPPNEKTDVYSFGVLALEVATGRRPVDNDGILLANWVWEMFDQGKLVECEDQRFMGKFDEMEMLGMLFVGLSCVHPNCTERPTMKEAAKMLRGEAPYWSYHPD